MFIHEVESWGIITVSLEYFETPDSLKKIRLFKILNIPLLN